MNSLKRFFFSFLPFIFIFLFALQPSSGGDILWHIRAGQWMLENHQILLVDPFSHTMLGKPLAPHGLLYQLIVGCIHNHFGWGGLSILNAGLVTTIFFFTLLWAKRFSNVSPWSIFSLFILGIPQFSIHPQVLFFGFTMALLFLSPQKDTPTPRWKLVLALLIVGLWPLIHPSYPFGFFLLFTFAVTERKKARQWILIPLAVTLFYLITIPEILSNVLHHAQSSAMLQNVKYWQPTFQAYNGNWATLAVYILLSIVTLVSLVHLFLTIRHQTLSLYIYLICPTILWMGYSSLRFYPLIFLILAPFFWIRIPKYFTKVFVPISCAVLFFIPYLSWGMGLKTDRLPVQGLKFIQNQKLNGNMFNSYNVGSFLIYANGPKVFIDPRSSQLYPDLFLESFLKAYEDPKHFEELVQQYNIGFTFLVKNSDKTTNLIDYLNHSPPWELVYEDSQIVIHKK